MLGLLRMLLLAAACAGCGGPSVADDGGPDAATEDAGAGSGDAGIDAGAAPDAGAPETDAGRVAIRFDDSACMAGPAHLWSDKSAMRFNSGIVHAESRPHADFAVAASFGGTIRLGTVDLTADSDGDAYVALIDAAGTFVWSQHFRGNGRQRVAGVARDGSGNLLVFGEFTEELLVGTETRAGYGPDDPDLFLASFSPSGALTWLQAFVGEGSDNASAVTADDLGNVFVAGDFDDPLVLDGNVVRAQAPGVSASRGSFVASFDASGAHRWSTGYPSFGAFASMTADADGNVYATGRYRLSRNLGAELPEPAGGADVFVVSYDTDGGHRWVRTLSGPEFDTGTAISTNAGLVVVVGRFRDSLEGGLVGLGREDMFITAFDSNGTVAWSQSLGGTGFTRADAVSIDDAGNVLVSGRVGESVALRGGTIEDPGILLLSMTRTGGCRWIHHIPSEVSAGATGLAFGEGDQLFFAGWGDGPIDLGGGAFPSGAGSIFASMR